ncbi:hypothetical protein [Streptomyces parvus]|nr:hypothetical protein [Streptomyces parvus]
MRVRELGAMRSGVVLLIRLGNPAEHQTISLDNACWLAMVLIGRI